MTTATLEPTAPALTEAPLPKRATQAPAIQFDRLRIVYPAKKRSEETKVAVKELSLSVAPGEVFGFLGPNGAGKTSSMNVLLGFLQPTSGSARIYGLDVTDPTARQRVGYLPELTYYYKFLTAEEILRFYAQLFSLSKEETDRRVEELLDLVELPRQARRKQLRTYSKGMQQRLGLAQALINDPDLLILDEPTSGLDPVGRMKVRDIIQKLKERGKTVFFSSHELGEVETVCDRVSILYQGELKVLGSVENLVREYECNLERIFLKVIGYNE